MQMITFLPNTTSSAQSLTAVSPVVFQAATTIAAGSGALPTVIADIATGSPANYGGQIINRGCADILVEMNYLDGDDCQPCTAPDALALAPVSFTVPANSSFPLPDGFWQDLQVTTLDSAGAPANVQTDQAVMTYSSYKPACPANLILAI